MRVDFYHNESSLIVVDSIKTSFSDVDRIMALLLPYFESCDFAPSKDFAPVGFDGVLNAYRNLLAGRENKKYVFVP